MASSTISHRVRTFFFFFLPCALCLSVSTWQASCSTIDNHAYRSLDSGTISHGWMRTLEITITLLSYSYFRWTSAITRTRRASWSVSNRTRGTSGYQKVDSTSNVLQEKLKDLALMNITDLRQKKLTPKIALRSRPVNRDTKLSIFSFSLSEKQPQARRLEQRLWLWDYKNFADLIRVRNTWTYIHTYMGTDDFCCTPIIFTTMTIIRFRGRAHHQLVPTDALLRPARAYH